MPPAHRFSPKVEKVLNAIISQLPAEIPSEMQRFYAIKLFERDDKITAMMNTVPDVGALIQKAEDELDDDAESIITNERYNYIGSIIRQCYTKKNQSRMSVSDKIDSIVTNLLAGAADFHSRHGAGLRDFDGRLVNLNRHDGHGLGQRCVVR